MPLSYVPRRLYGQTYLEEAMIGAGAIQAKILAILLYTGIPFKINAATSKLIRLDGLSIRMMTRGSQVWVWLMTMEMSRWISALRNVEVRSNMFNARRTLFNILFVPFFGPIGCGVISPLDEIDMFRVDESFMLLSPIPLPSYYASVSRHRLNGFIGIRVTSWKYQLHIIFSIYVCSKDGVNFSTFSQPLPFSQRAIVYHEHNRRLRTIYC